LKTKVAKPATERPPPLLSVLDGPTLQDFEEPAKVLRDLPGVIARERDRAQGLESPDDSIERCVGRLTHTSTADDAIAGVGTVGAGGRVAHSGIPRRRDPPPWRSPRTKLYFPVFHVQAVLSG
jgi:hypothetical protein